MKKFNPMLTSILTTSSLGGMLEMYDFVIYVFFAPTIAHLFFPKDDYFAALLSTFGIFAAGYLARPLGGFFFGHYGDKLSRKKGLIYTIMIMGIATLAIGLLPTYDQIGVTAAVLLFVIRIIQGLAVGGDLPGAITYVAEHSETKHRGLNCAILFCSLNIGILLASVVGTIITVSLTHQQLLAWGWRLGFLLSFLLLIVGLYLRLKLPESPLQVELMHRKELAKRPLVLLLEKKMGIRTLQGIGVIWLFATIIAQIYLYTPSYLHNNIHITMHRALLFNTISLVFFSALFPLMGYLSDKIGRKKILMIGAAGFVVFSYPLYLMLANGLPSDKLIALLILGIFSAAIAGPSPAFLAEMFRTRVRYSGVAVSYNIAFAIFAGLTPWFATWLIHTTGNVVSLAYNLIIAAMVALITLCFSPEHSRWELRDV